MFGDIMQPTHLLFVLLVALLVLGPKRLPEVGKTLGSGLRDFRDALSGNSSGDGPLHSWLDGSSDDETEQAAQAAQPATQPQPDLSYTAQSDPVYADAPVYTDAAVDTVYTDSSDGHGFPGSTPTVDTPVAEPAASSPAPVAGNGAVDQPAVTPAAGNGAVHQPAVTPVAHWEPEATPPPPLSVAPAAAPAPAGDDRPE